MELTRLVDPGESVEQGVVVDFVVVEEDETVVDTVVTVFVTTVTDYYTVQDF